ncbi:uncharacterized protein [Epargyreus clarus]|uniref:uncharacterized protein n=1 Tax=Epargyreus clarus TaxID=520877 RepID=UPI003C301347
MPRNYTRKTTRAMSYTQEDLEIVAQKIKDKKLTYAAASREYGIPTSTLSDRVLNKTRKISSTLGRATAIPKEHEDRLANSLRVLEKWGWGLSREEVLDIAQEFINKNCLNCPFNNGRPGADWFIAFCRRHNLSIKKPQPVEYLRKKMTDPFIISEYFKLLEQTLLELNLTDDPKRVWNLDETSLCLDPTRTKVVGAKGAACTRTTYGSAKENITVLTTVNAAGEKLDPLIVYKGKYLYQQWMVENVGYDFQLTYASSKRGWMESEIFFNYMLNVVIPNLGDDRPVLLLYDGHVSHVDDKVVELAVKHNITILKLPPHTSHLLQPLDLAVFKSFKNTWDKNLVKWQRQNVGIKLRKQYFAKMFADAWQQVKPEVIKNGFKKGGIFPFNASVISKEKFDPNAYIRWQKHIFQNHLRQPKLLKHLCLEAVNKTIIFNDRSDPVFNFNNPNLANKNSSALNPENQDHISFEDLLLKQIAQQPANTNNKIATKLKRVAKGGEVITKSFLQKQNEIAQNKEKEAQKTKQKIKRKQPQPRKQNEDPAKPGPSGIQKKRNQQKPTNPSQTLTDQTNRKQYITVKGKGIGKKTKSDKENITLDDGKNNNEIKDIRVRSEKDDKINLTDSKVQRTIKKGTTTRKRKSRKDKNITSTQNTGTKKRFIKRKRTSSIDTTDESLLMSVHSDSDLYDVELFDCDMFTEIDPIDCDKIPEKHGNIEEQGCENKNDKVTILSSIKLRPENQAFYKIHGSLNLQPIEKDYDLFTLKQPKLETNQKHKIETDGSYHEEDEYNAGSITYEIGDTVLVRYFKKAWRYYAGVIEAINNLKPKLYTISFYKTIKKKTDVFFNIPKIEDRDFVPDINIVKEIRLLQIQENPAKYTIMDDGDAIYF